MQESVATDSSSATVSSPPLLVIHLHLVDQLVLKILLQLLQRLSSLLLLPHHRSFPKKIGSLRLGDHRSCLPLMLMRIKIDERG